MLEFKQKDKIWKLISSTKWYEPHPIVWHYVDFINVAMKEEWIKVYFDLKQILREGIREDNGSTRLKVSEYAIQRFDEIIDKHQEKFTAHNENLWKPKIRENREIKTKGYYKDTSEN